MPFDSTESKLDTNNAVGSENNKAPDAGVAPNQQAKPEHRVSHEVELRDAFFKTDFSERAGSPAHRLELISKAAEDLTVERQEAAAAKQKEEDAGFWEQEKSGSSSGASEKDTTIKPAPKQEEAAPKQQDSQPKDDIKSSSKVEIKDDKKPASPKSKEAPLKRTHDDDVDHSSEMPTERVSRLEDRPFVKSKAFVERSNVHQHEAHHEHVVDMSTVDEEVELNKTLIGRKKWHAKHGRDRDDPDNHSQGTRPSLRDELSTHVGRLFGSTETENTESTQSKPAGKPAAHLELHNKQLDRQGLRGDNKDDVVVATQPTTGIAAKLSDAKQTIGAKLSDAKEMVNDKIEAAEDKLSHWKDEAAAKLDHTKKQAVELKDDAMNKAADLKDDAMNKASNLKDDAMNKASNLRDDASSKATELKRSAIVKKDELSRDMTTKKAEISRDIDSKRADISRKGDEISRDVRTRTSELKSDAKSITSTIRSQAHTISEDVKSEVKFDVQAVKEKMNEIGSTLSNKKDELQHDISSKKAEISRDISNKKAELSRSIDNRDEIVESRQQPTGILAKVSSWWSGNKAESTGSSLISSRRLSRDPDAKDMQIKLDELRASNQHDWVNQADKASAFDIDNAPSSPRSWSNDSPRSPISRSASPVQRSASPVAYRSASPIARSATPIQQEGGFFEAFDPTIMDAAVEPW